MATDTSTPRGGQGNDQPANTAKQSANEIGGLAVDMVHEAETCLRRQIEGRPYTMLLGAFILGALYARYRGRSRDY